MSVQETNLKAIADAIREKEGSTEPIPASEFPARILALETGGTPEDAYMIALESSDPEGGAVSGGGLASEGMTVTVRADTAEGYKFAGWQEDGETVSEDAAYTFAVAGDRALVTAFEGSRLPGGYSEVEYISIAGFSRITTRPRIILGQGRAVLDVALTQSISGATLPLLNAPWTTAGTFGLYYNWSTGRLMYNCSTGTTYTALNCALNLNERVKIDFDALNRVVLVNDTSYSASNVTTGSVTAQYVTLGGNSLIRSQAMNIYAAKIYNNGELLLDLVPCVDPTGDAGLYDLLGGEFCGSGGTGTITAGPAV